MGLATAKAAAAEGAQVVITGRSQEKLNAANAQLPAGSRSAALDVADEAGTRALFDQIGHVDHLFITAASVTLGAGLAADTEKLRPGMDTRFWGSLYAAKYGAAQMKNGGSITFMSGVSAWRPRPGWQRRSGIMRRHRGVRAIAGNRACADPRQHDRARLHRHAAYRRAGRRAKASPHRNASIAAARQTNRNTRRHRRRRAVPHEERFRHRHHA